MDVPRSDGCRFEPPGGKHYQTLVVTLVTVLIGLVLALTQLVMTCENRLKLEQLPREVQEQRK